VTDSDDELEQALQSFSADARNLDAMVEEMKGAMAMDAIKVKELEKLVLASAGGSSATLNEEVNSTADQVPEPATPGKSWTRSLGTNSTAEQLPEPATPGKSWTRGLGTRLRSLSVDNPWTQNTQNSFTLSHSSQEELEQVIGLSSLKSQTSFDLPAEARTPFDSPSKTDEPLKNRLRARSELATLETSPTKLSVYPPGLMSPVRGTGGFMRMSPSPLRSSPLAMLARSWSDKVTAEQAGSA
jgi:hypothetical protein